jgi:GntR family transcriptional repressor for pyruvate dehydrogenase complex
MENKREEVVRKLSGWIENPDRFPGGHLPPERVLAREMGVSRTLLREAVITLEALGVLEVRERQGIFVRTPREEDFAVSLRTLNLWPEDILIHLMEMRLVVEVPAAGLSALRRTEEELEQMRKCVLQLEEVHAAPDGGASSGAYWDSLLHALVVSAAHNPILTRVYEGLATTMEKYIVTSRSLLLSYSGMSGKILEEHELLVDSIARGDPEGAMAALRRHLEEAMGQLVKLRASGVAQKKTTS